jgi:flagellin
MASYINTNIASLNAQRNLSTSQGALATSIQRLSSGLRVNSAKDDAAGLAIASRMESQIRGQTVAQRNANDAISFSQTAEGALGKVTDSLQRMRELAVQSANATNSADDRTNLNSEYQALATEITRVLTSTQFNGTKMLGADAGAKVFQVGAGTTAEDTISVTTTDLTGDTTITAVTGGSVTSVANSTTAMNDIDTALTTINTERSKMGATQNRFQNVVENLQTSTENLQASRSRIIDADYASETATLARNQILQQAGMAMLAQANQLPNNVMTLLR